MMMTGKKEQNQWKDETGKPEVQWNLNIMRIYIITKNAHNIQYWLKQAPAS
jgi:hypothetical protein